MSLIKRLLALALCLSLIVPSLAWAQQAAPAAAPPAAAAPAGGGMVMGANGQPQMQNVFFNVLWGSMTGGMLYSALNVLDDSRSKGERYSFSRMTTQFITGATYGAFAGLVTGVYISLAGISFDPGRSRIGQAPVLARPLHGDEVLLANYQFKF
ncbi:MAG: hypothetical protein RRB13_09645 [bacterium]|nr:hypothetical protein [bacterium]